MNSGELAAYETPAITEIGTVAELTHGRATGVRNDAPFPDIGSVVTFLS